jgi:N-acetylglutamate synthase-like GNAT family acetyltransferase
LYQYSAAGSAAELGERVSAMRLKSSSGIASALVLRPVSVDELSLIRYVHSSSYRSLVGPTVDPDEVDAFCALVHTALYADQILAERHFAAWLGRELIGSAGWVMSDDESRCARLSSVYVQPMFVRCGVGRRLVRHVEADARDMGLDRFRLKATPNSAAFFEKMGYRSTARVPAGKASRTAARHMQKSDSTVATVAKQRRLELV